MELVVAETIIGAHGRCGVSLQLGVKSPTLQSKIFYLTHGVRDWAGALDGGRYRSMIGFIAMRDLAI